jgi:site-specific recombinase XerD
MTAVPDQQPERRHLSIVPEIPLPGVCDDLLEQSREYARHSQADETKRAYKRDWATFEAFCAERGFMALLATPDVVDMFLVARAATIAPQSLGRALSAITYVHAQSGFVSPCESAIVKAKLAGVRRTKKVDVEKAEALSAERLAVVVDGLGTSLRDSRDRAMLLVGWAGALRRSEIVSIDHDDVGFGEQGVTIRLRQTKSSQDTVVSVDIPKAKNEAVCPVLALKAWLELSRITEGPVFCGMRKGDHLTDGRLSDRHVDGIIRRLAGPEYSGHSLRAGWCTAAGRAGALLADSMRHSRHKSERVAIGYQRAGRRWIDHPGANLL